jgi:hypothetical protein
MPIRATRGARCGQNAATNKVKALSAANFATQKLTKFIVKSPCCGAKGDFWPTRLGVAPSYTLLMPHYPSDENNPLWVKGWGVLRSEPWHLQGLYPSRVEADVQQAALGSDYESLMDRAA